MKSRILKTIGLVTAVVSCIGMTVFAAPSPVAGTVVTGVKSAVDNRGTSANVVITSTIPEASKSVAAEIKTETKLKEVLGSDFNENLTVADVLDVYVTGDASGITYPIDVTFTMKGVTKNTKVQILQYKDGAWVKIPTTVGEGTATARFDSLSLVAFVVDKTTIATGATSPETSASAVSTVALIGLAAVVFAFGLKKKSVIR